MMNSPSIALRALTLSNLLLASMPMIAAHAVPEVIARSSDADLENKIERWMKGTEQKRPLLTSNAILSRIARARAADMGRRNYYSAVTPEGNGPNFDVTQAGYVLPDYYDKARTANNLQFYVAAATPEEAWKIWMKSPNIRAKIFGLTESYARQREYGIGHAYIPASKYKHYWVLLMAEPGSRALPGNRSQMTKDAKNSTPTQLDPEATRTQAEQSKIHPKDGDVGLESQIATWMKGSGQQRPSLTFNPILAQVARARAADMGRRNYFAHINPDGVGPNTLVTQAGYILPAFYGNERSGNSIESIHAGGDTAEKAWDSWMHSPPHRKHILGLSDFYAGQIEYGIGHAYILSSQYKHYWVIITAKPGP
jgi:uncharacterized protein YkwD